jgi:hypothetical protein
MLRPVPRALALVVAAIGFTAVPAVASAAITVQVPDSAPLTAGVLVTVPVTVACGPYEVTPTQSGISVTIQQSAKKGIAYGSGSFGGFASTAQLTCDGAPHTYDIDVLANTSGLPFRKGDAIVSAYAHAVLDFCCTSDSGGAGPTTIRLR